MVGSLATTILNITDTAFLGRIGETELGASAVSGILYFVFVMIGVSIGIGTQILIARRAGEKDHQAIGEIFDQSFILLFGISLVLFLFLIFGSPLLLRLILRDEKILEASIDFLTYRSYGIFFVMTATAYRSFYVGIAQPGVWGTYSFIMAGVNLVLGYGFIFGNLGLPNLGIVGAGLASSIAELVALIFIVIYTMYKPDINSFQLFRFRKFSRELNERILQLSSPLVVQNLLSMGAWFIFFVFIEKIGSHELAISNVVRGAYMIAMTPIWGFSVAANSMVSNIIGQSRQNEIMRLLNRILKLSIGTTIAMCLVLALFQREILGIFTNDIGLIDDAKGSFQIVILSMFSFAAAIVIISAVSGTGATRTALYIEIAAILLYLVYNYIVTFVYHGTVEMVWLSELIYWIFTGVVSYVFMKSLRWKKITI